MLRGHIPEQIQRSQLPKLLSYHRMTEESISELKLHGNLIGGDCSSSYTPSLQYYISQSQS